ncbi:SMI1/KNR4 family protein [Bacillus thuringiensis]|uniref:SMI1/KNR4 family protein n=1 Tax=Bacillus thuringiensis TaxID=1428 RepID=UPI0021D6604F|nr:SMI1/KNR4 family protein [Bacillus thuringiensis]MCU7667362.1 SMI1/KNR4 family protein [Bacillus thuringiensis]
MKSSAAIFTQIGNIIRKLNEKNIRLNPVLTEEEIKDFEDTHKVTLPEEYREFLKFVGNGGPGPYYGLIPLQKSAVESVNNDDLKDELQTEMFEGEFLHLSHEGCGYYYVLALTGEESGNIWNDSRAASYGMRKVKYGFGHYAIPYGFLDWYEHWIDSGAKGMEEMKEMISNLNNNN